jgi:transcriptional regulator with XRE-family HTH domain
MTINTNQTHGLRIRFAANLREHRQTQGLSQEALADLAGLHRTYVSQVERTVTNVSLDNVHKLAQALGVDAYVLFMPRDGEVAGKKGEVKSGGVKGGAAVKVAAKKVGGKR